MNDLGLEDIYTLHIKRHKRGNILVSPNCEACQKGFLHVNSLQVRQFTQTGRLPGICRNCNTAFLKICRVQIRNMTQSDTQHHVCEVCGKAFTHAGNYLKHKKLHDREMEGGDVTSITTSAASITTSATSITTSANKSFSCDTCGKGFVQAASFLKHKQMHEAEKEGAVISSPATMAITSTVKPEPPYTCEKCGKLFMKYGSFLNHCENHDIPENLTCPICEHVSDSKVTYKNHVERCKSRQAVYVCHFCETTFDTKSSLKVHLETHVETHVCKFCKATFTVAEDLEQHLLQHLNDHTNVGNGEDESSMKTEDAEEEVKEGKFNHFCVECKKGFVRLGTLRNHMKTHAGNLPYQCKTCKKPFVLSSRLKKHMKLHAKSRPYSCKQCPRVFTSLKGFRKHRTSHTKREQNQEQEQGM